MIKNGHKVLFIGDSITDSNRHRAHAPLGDGYVKLFRDLMIFRQPTVTVQVVNKGIGGNKVDLLPKFISAERRDSLMIVAVPRPPEQDYLMRCAA